MSASEDNSPGSLSDAEERSPDASNRHGDDHEAEDDLGDDLFGDGDDDALEDEDDGPALVLAHYATSQIKLTVIPRRKRQLDDEELDSGDDEGRGDRMQGTREHSGDEGDAEGLKIAQIPVPRHAVPEPSDNEVRKRARFSVSILLTWNSCTFLKSHGSLA